MVLMLPSRGCEGSPHTAGTAVPGEAKSKLTGKAAWQGTCRLVIIEGWIFFFSFLKLPTETISHFRRAFKGTAAAQPVSW